MRKIFLLVLFICSGLMAQKIVVSKHTTAHMDSILARVNTTILNPNIWQGVAVDTGKTSAKLISVNGKKGVVTFTADEISDAGSANKYVTTDEKTTWNNLTLATNKLTANKTVTLTSSMTAAQIQDSINAMPKNLAGFQLIFLFSDGTYTFSTSGIVFKGFFGGLLNVYGNTGESGLHSNQAVIINRTCAANSESVFQFENISAPIIIKNIRINITDGTYTSCRNIYAKNCAWVQIIQNYLTHTVKAGWAALYQYTNGIWQNNYITRSAQGFRADYVSTVCANINTSITADPDYGYYAGSGAIVQVASTTFPSPSFNFDYGSTIGLQHMQSVQESGATGGGAGSARYGGDGVVCGNPTIWFTMYDPTTGTAYRVPAY